MATAHHFLINPGRRAAGRARSNPVLTIFGNPPRGRSEFTAPQRKRISTRIGQLVRKGDPVSQAAAIAYDEARRGSVRSNPRRRSATRHVYRRNATEGGRQYYRKAGSALADAGKHLAVGAYRSGKKYGKKGFAGARAGLSAGWKAFRAANPRRETSRTTRRSNSPMRARRYRANRHTRRRNAPARRRRYAVRSNPRRRTRARANPVRRRRRAHPRRRLRANPVRRRRRANPRRRYRANAHRRRRANPSRRRRRNPSMRRRRRANPRRRYRANSHRRRSTRRNPRRRYRTNSHRRRSMRRNPRRGFRLFRRNPDYGLVVKQAVKDAVVFLAGFWGTNFVSSLVPFGGGPCVPGTTCGIVDTAVDVAAAGALGFATAKMFGGEVGRRVLAGGLAAAIVNFLKCVSFLQQPHFQAGFGAYPRMSAYPAQPARLGMTTGTNLIGPGSLGSRQATVQAAHARYGAYPSAGMRGAGM